MVPIKLEPLDLIKYIRTNRIQVKQAHIKELKKMCRQRYIVSIRRAMCGKKKNRRLKRFE